MRSETLESPRTKDGWLALVRFAARWAEPSRYVVDSVALNRLGLQVLRTVTAGALHKLRRRRVGPAVASFAGPLERDGLIEIPNFLDPEDFRQLISRLQSFIASGAMPTQVHKDGSAIRVMGPITKQNEDGKWIIQRVAENPVLLQLVSLVMRREVTRPPQLIYQRMELPGNAQHTGDKETVLHADRHFTTVKAYLTLNRNDRANGAYVWCPGSHRLSLPRLRHEYEYSVNQARFQKFGASAVAPEVLEANRIRPSPRACAAMALKEHVIESDANTLVVSNNMGFHRRGILQAGHCREQLRMIFHYLEEPFYATAGWRVIRWLEERRCLPASLSADLRKRGLL